MFLRPSHARTNDRAARVLAALLIPVLLGTPGCATKRMVERADREVYGIIREKTGEVPGMDPEFTIDQTLDESVLETLPKVEENDSGLGEGMRDERGWPVVSLEQALHLAVSRNRTYQGRKESLYLQALRLTLARHEFDPIFSGRGSASYNRTTRDVVTDSDFAAALKAYRQSVPELEALTNTPGALLRSYADLVEASGDLAGLNDPETHIVDERSVDGQTSVGINLLAAGGARIAVGLTSSFLRYLTGLPREQASSSLTAEITQPLLRGAGSAVTLEELTQAERDVLYALRDFTQYRKDFTVDVCSDYYNILQRREIIRNTWSGLQGFRQSVERQKAFVEEGLSRPADLGRLRQAQLENENGYTNAVRQYYQDLDRFKITLGLSTDTNLRLDDAELTALREGGLLHPKITSEDAVRVALEARLDLQNARDAAEDAERRLRVAENSLLPRLDLVGGASVKSVGNKDWDDLDFRRMVWNAGIDVDPVFDRKAIRNAYRSSVIGRESALRERSLAEDNVKLGVQASWRNLEQARQSHEIALESVHLSERRVEEQDLLAELGMATAQDQVDARNDLIKSQNSLTAAVIGHTVARLQFWKDMGILYIKKDGRWEEVTDHAAPTTE